MGKNAKLRASRRAEPPQANKPHRLDGVATPGQIIRASIVQIKMGQEGLTAAFQFQGQSLTEQSIDQIKMAGANLGVAGGIEAMQDGLDRFVPQRFRNQVNRLWDGIADWRSSSADPSR
jgi:hypothetical protein